MIILGKRKLDVILAECLDGSAKKEYIREELKEIIKAYNELADKYEVESGKVVAVEYKLQEVNKENAKLVEINKKIKASYDDSENTILSLMKEIEEYKENCGKLEERLDYQLKKNQSLKTSYEPLEKELKKSYDEYNFLTNEKNDLLEDYCKLEITLDDLKWKFEKSQEQKSNIEKNLRKALEVKDSLKIELEKCKDRLSYYDSKVWEEREAYSSKVTNLKAEELKGIYPVPIEENNYPMAVTSEQLTKMAELEASVTSLKEQVKQEKTISAELSRSKIKVIDDSVKDSNAKDKTILELSKLLSKFERECSLKDEVIESLEYTIQDQEEKIFDLERDIDDLSNDNYNWINDNNLE